MDLIPRKAAIAVIEKELEEERASLIGNKVFLCTVSVLESVLEETRRISAPWISVKDRLPEVDEENGSVFFMDGLQGCFRSVIAWYVDGSGKSIVEPLSFYIDRNNNPHWTVYNNVFHDFPFRVSRWMPFPDAPTEQ